jgi:putative FmdB family regulatory protein
MPVFEYKCSKCSSRFEVLHKSINNIENVECPDWHSSEINKLLSSFSASGFAKSGSSYSASADNCETGTCGCSSGYCGLN